MSIASTRRSHIPLPPPLCNETCACRDDSIAIHGCSGCQLRTHANATSPRCRVLHVLCRRVSSAPPAWQCGSPMDVSRFSWGTCQWTVVVSHGAINVDAACNFLCDSSWAPVHTHRERNTTQGPRPQNSKHKTRRSLIHFQQELRLTIAASSSAEARTATAALVECKAEENQQHQATHTKMSSHPP